MVAGVAARMTDELLKFIWVSGYATMLGALKGASDMWQGCYPITAGIRSR